MLSTHPISPSPTSQEAARILDLCKERGWLLLRGLTSDAEAFRDFTNVFDLSFLAHQGPALGHRDAVLPDEPTIATSDKGMWAIGPHTERGYVPVSPDFLFFHCQKPSAERGETLLVDGAAVYDALTDALKEFASELWLQFKMNLGPHSPRELSALLQSVGAPSTKDAGLLMDAVAQSMLRPNHRWECSATEESLSWRYSYPLVRKAKWSDKVVVCGYLVEYLSGSFDGAATLCTEDGTPAAEHPRSDLLVPLFNMLAQSTHYHSWQAGDVVIVDNDRAMHGRHGFTDPRRSISLRMALAPAPA